MEEGESALNDQIGNQPQNLNIPKDNLLNEGNPGNIQELSLNMNFNNPLPEIVKIKKDPLEGIENNQTNPNQNQNIPPSNQNSRHIDKKSIKTIKREMDQDSISDLDNYSNQHFFDYRNFNPNELKPKVPKKTNPMLDNISNEVVKKSKKPGNKWLKKAKVKPSQMKNQTIEDAFSTSSKNSHSLMDMADVPFGSETKVDFSPLTSRDIKPSNKSNKTNKTYNLKKDLDPITEEKSIYEKGSNEKSTSVKVHKTNLFNPENAMKKPSTKSFLDKVLEENSSKVGDPNKSKRSASNSSHNSLEFNNDVGSKKYICDFNNDSIKQPPTRYELFAQQRTGNKKNPFNQGNFSFINKNSFIPGAQPKIKTGERDDILKNINNQMNNLGNEGQMNTSNSMNKKGLQLTDYDLEIRDYDEKEGIDQQENKRGDSLSGKRNSNSFISKNPKQKTRSSVLEDLDNINPKAKKEREKMDGHPCELCKKFFDFVGEQCPNICEQCSRHRTNNRVDHTPKGFYDLNI